MKVIVPGSGMDLLERSSLKSVLRGYEQKAKIALRQDFASLDPVRWIEKNLKVTLWGKQRDIVESVMKYSETFVPSCFGSGKSFTAACMATFWVCNYLTEGMVVTTAPSNSQVYAILWQEIRRLGAGAAIPMPGRIMQKEWKVGPVGREDTLVAFGRSPKDYEPTSFQGIHRPYILVIIDEAPGVSPEIWEAVRGLLTSEHARLLAIGNPESSSGPFFDGTDPSPDRNTIHISVFDTPNFADIKHAEPPEFGETAQKEWREGMLRQMTVLEDRPAKIPALVTIRWARRMLSRLPLSHPTIESKVFGKFPRFEKGAVIPWGWIRSSQTAHGEIGQEEIDALIDMGEPIAIGLDPARFGDCESVMSARLGYLQLAQDTTVGQDGPQILLRLKEMVMGLSSRYGVMPTRISIDEPGIGGYLIDFAKKEPWVIGNKIRIVSVNTARPARYKRKYANRRAELWWDVREKFDKRLTTRSLVLVPDDEIASQLSAPTYSYQSGRILVESKEDLRKRGVPDLGRADAWILTFAEPSPLDLADRMRNKGRAGKKSRFSYGRMIAR